MGMDVVTKDCTALSDGELTDMADLGADRPNGFDIGFLSKQREEWVLVTQVREGAKLRGYSFCTLERIGGTPCLLVGVAGVGRTSRADTALKAMMADQYRRALLAFPDEDVLMGTRLLTPDGFRAFTGLTDVVPCPGEKCTGEDRAWARRLAKRFGDEQRLDDRTFRITAAGSVLGGIDYVASKPRETEGLAELFSGDEGDRLVVFGWAMAEDLASGKLGR